MSKKYYAVKEGRNIGVFNTWAECEAQVKGYPGAKYKSFKTLDEAKAFVTGDEIKKVDQNNISKDEAIAYVDGSYNIDTKVVGFGVVFITSDDIKEISEFVKDESLSDQRNVAGEIFGSMKAINMAVEMGIKKIYIHHDYTGISEWALGNWKTNIELTKDYKKFIDEVKSKIEISFVKVKAHSNDKYNDLADRLAKDACGVKWGKPRFFVGKIIL